MVRGEGINVVEDASGVAVSELGLDLIAMRSGLVFVIVVVVGVDLEDVFGIERRERGGADVGRGSVWETCCTT